MLVLVSLSHAYLINCSHEENTSISRPYLGWISGVRLFFAGEHRGVDEDVHVYVPECRSETRVRSRPSSEQVNPALMYVSRGLAPTEYNVRTVCQQLTLVRVSNQHYHALAKRPWKGLCYQVRSLEICN